MVDYYDVGPSLVVAAISLLFGSFPVFMGKLKELKQRWWVWAGLFTIYGSASALLVYGNFPWFFYVLILVTISGMLREVLKLKGLSVGYRTLLILWVAILPMAWLLNAPKFFALFVVVAAFDIGGWIGGHSALNQGPLSIKLAPGISPNKTWAGVVGGVLLAGMANNVLGVFLGWPFWLLCLLAVVGDLIESAVKRKAGIKDFETVLPGFGGVLDRFDSLIFAGLVLFFV